MKKIMIMIVMSSITTLACATDKKDQEPSQKAGDASSPSENSTNFTHKDKLEVIKEHRKAIKEARQRSLQSKLNASSTEKMATSALTEALKGQQKPPATDAQKKIDPSDAAYNKLLKACQVSSTLEQPSPAKRQQKPSAQKKPDPMLSKSLKKRSSSADTESTPDQSPASTPPKSGQSTLSSALSSSPINVSFLPGSPDSEE